MTRLAAECHAFRAGLLLSSVLEPPSAHAASCAACRAFLEAEAGVRAHLRNAAPRWAAPASLREKVASIFADAQATRARPLARRQLLATAAAVGAALAAGAWWWRGRVAPAQRRADELTRLIVEDHLQYAARGPDKLEVANPSPEAVESFFAAELHLAVALPALSGASVVGGRRCNLAGRPAALAFLQHTQGPLSLFVLESGDEAWGGAPSEGKRRPWQRALRGIGVVVWNERGLTYALAGAREPAELLALLE